ncbi:uncharacterized protein LOC119174122 isoform X1 [Rhipicephalus microplus]|uniref:uncharacterized protein LOC119174122 isoform X1 n=1 Tax=Rhipicephalus microplus TaxID=6941 RepID=UPI003F6BBF31
MILNRSVILTQDHGECLTVNFTRTGITDVWHRMYQKEQWRPYLPDLRAAFTERFCFDSPVDEEELMEREKKALTYAGLNLISCRAYRSQWILPSVNACVDLYVPLFKMNAKIPEEKQNDFVDAFKSTIYEVSGTTAGRVAFNYDIIVTHSQKTFPISLLFMQKSVTRGNKRNL